MTISRLHADDIAEIHKELARREFRGTLGGQRVKELLNHAFAQDEVVRQRRKMSTVPTLVLDDLEIAVQEYATHIQQESWESRTDDLYQEFHASDAAAKGAGR